MNKNKTKTLVLVVLGVALVGVGAFQFLPKGGSQVEMAKVGKKSTASNPTTATTNHSEATAMYAEPTNAAPAAETTPPTGGAAGATGSPAGPTATGGEIAKADVDPAKEYLRQMVKDPLPPRDPFTPQVKPETMTTPAAPVNTTPVKAPSRPSGGYRPPPMGGGVKPWEPPLPSGGGLGTGSGPIGLSSGTPLRQPSEFAYQVKGVIVGKRPMAVFEDDNGNQRLVPLGGSLDGDSKVVGIEKGKVRIRHRGKEKTLDLPEGP